MEHLTIEQQIRAEIYKAFEQLGADTGLLATVGSWGDTLDDQQILSLLTNWNAEEERRQQAQGAAPRGRKQTGNGRRLGKG